MSNIDTGADQSYDVFDDVVETGDFDANEQGNSEEDSGIIEASANEDNGDDIESVGEESGEVAEQERPEVDADEESESEEAKEEESESQDDEESKEDEKEEEESDKEKDESESDVELAKAVEDGTLEVEVGEEKITLKQLKEDYKGQKEVARRFSELDVEKKAHMRDVEEIENYINDFAGLIRKGDAVGAMSYFGNFSGMPPHQIKEQLITQLAPEIIRRQQMDPKEIQAEYLQAENRYLQEQRESEAEIREKEQANSALQASIQNLRETHNIEEQEWTEVEAELRETLEEGEELTPEKVAEGVKFKRDFSMAASVFDNFSGQLNEEQGELFFDSLVDVKQKYPHFTEEDLKEVAEQAMSQIKQSSTKEKLTKKVAEKKKIQPKKQQTKSQTQEPEIDPELEDWL